jgi:hypothetical protein
VRHGRPTTCPGDSSIRTVHPLLPTSAGASGLSAPPCRNGQGTLTAVARKQCCAASFLHKDISGPGLHSALSLRSFVCASKDFVLSTELPQGSHSLCFRATLKVNLILF